MKITIRCASKVQEVDISAGNETEESSDSLKTLGELKKITQEIAQSINLDPSSLKIIKASRTLTGDDSTPLSAFKFKENEKIMVMGRPMQADPILKQLNEYEKKNLIDLQDTFLKIGQDLTELEKDFLEGSQREEMIRKMDKRVKLFNEAGLRHLMALDAISMSNEQTTPEQVQRNRERRKALIDGIDHLLNLNDKYGGRLKEYQTKAADTGL
ncbi:unnamed protein product, partial [Mesorhabditis belari]|uniref:BAG domain-containing protein n=1 Tax=Mesorhabditis belari TaxID=2138241 RepID=A0AAF3J9Q7_9BILA